MNTLEQIALDLRNDRSAIQLLYAFNSVGKTRLSVEYQNLTKDDSGNHTGIYYNAYSEDLFVWNNDTKSSKSNSLMTVLHSNLSILHKYLTEDRIQAKLMPYRVSFNFIINMHSDIEDGIKSISFFPKDAEFDGTQSMKISRGEERIFVWCFFLAMMEIEGWSDIQSEYIFIDDPVSSLDDYNIFVTASTIYNLIEAHAQERKIIIATHHVGFLSILSNWLKKGDKSAKYFDITKVRILSRKHENLSMETVRNDVLLYHLRLFQIIEESRNKGNVSAFHFSILRQLLEIVSSFLGVGRFSYALERIGYENTDEIAQIVNSLSHRNIYSYDLDHLAPANLQLLEEIMEKLKKTFDFKTH